MGEVCPDVKTIAKKGKTGKKNKGKTKDKNKNKKKD